MSKSKSSSVIQWRSLLVFSHFDRAREACNGWSVDPKRGSRAQEISVSALVPEAEHTTQHNNRNVQFYIKPQYVFQGENML